MNENSLNNKLNRIDETLAVMKTNLHLPENEVIENLAEATNLHGLVNVFVQEEEPEKKEGIWFKTTKQSFKDIIVDNNPITPYRWRSEEKTLIPRANGSHKEKFVAKGNYLYGTWDNTMGGAKWDITNNFAIKCFNNPGYVTQAQFAGVFIDEDNKMYIVSPASGKIVEIDLDTEEHVEYTKTGSISHACYSPYDKKIYYIYHNSPYPLYSFDTQTKECKQELERNVADNIACIYAVGEYLIAFSSVSGRTKVRKLSNNLAEAYLSDSNISSYTTGKSSTTMPEFVDYQNYIYLFYPDGHADRIDKDTLYVTEDVIPADPSLSTLWNVVVYNDEIYGLTGSDSKLMYWTPMAMTSGEYDNDSIILTQAPIQKSFIQTQLWDIVLQNRLLYSFYDAYYYNKENGFAIGIPTYYGNGTEWVKFKN